jgi:hypothetical protein
MQKVLQGSTVAALACCALLSGCRGAAVPNQVLAKPAPAPVAAPIARTGGPWAYRPSVDRQGFVVDQRAVVSIRSDTTTRADTIESHVELAFIVAPAGNVVAGNVSVFRVAGGGRPAATPAGLAVPFAVRAEYAAREAQLIFTSPRDDTPCASLARSAAQSLRDVWFRPPDTLRTGALWQDSTSYVMCRDGVPLRATTHRTFRVSAASTNNGRTTLSISRSSRTTFDGAGAQFGESVTVSGAGNGELNYVFDPSRGEILSASGSSTLDLTLRSRARTQAVRQSTETRIGRS